MKDKVMIWTFSCQQPALKGGNTMKHSLRKTLVALLLLTLILSATLPAFASSPWYRTGPGVTKTLNVTHTHRPNPTSKRWIYLLQQDNSGKYLFVRNGRYAYASVKGWYKVSITQTKDYYGRSVYRTICNNYDWKSGSNYLKANLVSGTYRVSMRLYGAVYSASLSRQGWRPVRWYNGQYPWWRIA